MNSPILSMLPWLFTAFVLGAMHIASAVILLRDRHFSAWLMLAGSCVALVGQTGVMVYQVFLMRAGNFNIGVVITAISAFSSLGALLFAIGLLLHALHQRSKANRIQELETILASLQKP